MPKADQFRNGKETAPTAGTEGAEGEMVMMEGGGKRRWVWMGEQSRRWWGKMGERKEGGFGWGSQ